LLWNLQPVKPVVTGEEYQAPTVFAGRLKVVAEGLLFLRAFAI
jgi:hypothetical protein